MFSHKISQVTGHKLGIQCGSYHKQEKHNTMLRIKNTYNIIGRLKLAEFASFKKGLPKIILYHIGLSG